MAPTPGRRPRRRSGRSAPPSPKLLFAAPGPDGRPRINNVGNELGPTWEPHDRGYDEPDHGQYDQPEDVWGWCGAAVLLRRRYLDEVGRFDERLFMYCEDVDLSWRGAHAGWRYRYVPTSVVHHAAPGQLRRRAHPAPRLPEPPQPARGGDAARRVARRRDRLEPRARRDRRRASAPTCSGRSSARRRPDLGAAAAAGASASSTPAACWRGATPRCRKVPHHAGHGDRRDGVRRPAPRRAPPRGRRRRHRPRPPRRPRRSTSPTARRSHAAIAEAAPEAVYHLAGWADVGASWQRSRGGASASTPRAPCTCCRPASRGRRRPRARRRQRRRLRRGHRGRAAAHRGLAAAPDQPVRRVASWPPTPSAQQAFLGHGLGRHPGAAVQPPRPGPVRAVRGPRHRRPHRPRRARRHRRRSRSATCRPGATSPTCATSCGPTGCSSSAASRARSTTCAPGRTSPSRRSPTSWSGSPVSRSSS